MTKANKQEVVSISHDDKGLTVANMPVNPNKPLDVGAKGKLDQIIRSSFVGQTTRYQMELSQRKLDIQETYRKTCGVEKLFKQLDELNLKQARLVEQIGDLGFNAGNKGLQLEYIADDKLSPKAKQVKQDLNALVKSNNPIETLRDKYLTRLYMSTTMGEAAVIMREVLGNNQLPSLKAEDIKST